MTNLSPAAQILRDLIRCPSVTPEEGGALSYLHSRLEALGFKVTRKISTAPNTPDVENLYARLGTKSPNLCFAGHTDVVPTGDIDSWSLGPFEGAVKDGVMYGRGAVDMKGGIACFLAAVEEQLESGIEFPGSISFLITGDEEGPAINGTDAVLKWLAEDGEEIDACLVGEPTNPNTIGDAIKIGRRGSLSGTITVNGVQGHAAYPHLADNPSRGIIALTQVLMENSFDQGTDSFQPTNLEVTSIDIGNPAFNVLAEKATANFNIRFNDTWEETTIKSEIERRLKEASIDQALRAPLAGGPRPPIDYSLSYVGRTSHVFLTQDNRLVGSLASAILEVAGKEPELSTAGGTSDGRFIKDVCPVLEFGLVGQTMHQVDERVELKDLETLTNIYLKFIQNFFSA
ncbi:MAG: succinyl-diaminopimelate desuccinylase [Rhizobiaceae bacterium]